MIRLFKVAMNNPTAQELVAQTLGSGYIGEGPRVAEFERRFGDLIGAPEPPVAVNSCTSAITLALHLAGVGPGDEVITTPMTCAATNAPIVTAGARIVWADVDPVTGCIDPEDVWLKMRCRTKAVIAVDWGGRLCNYYRLKDPNIQAPIISDAAHSLLARIEGDAATTPWIADYTCYSYQAIKHLTTGDGGALLCWNREQAARARRLRWYGLDRNLPGWRDEQRITEVGYKFQMNDIAASIGLANLEIVESVVARHRENARYYHGALADLPGVTLPPADEGSAWWLYTLLLDDRASFQAWMQERGIETSPVHARNDLHPAFRAAAINGDERLPGVDAFAAHEVAIPVGWWLGPDERERIVEAVRGWAMHRASVSYAGVT